MNQSLGSHPIEQELLFTRANIEAIGQRFAVYILQRKMNVHAAWRQAVEDEAALIQYKLELMEEGLLVWDWPSQQLVAMRQALQQQMPQSA